MSPSLDHLVSIVIPCFRMGPYIGFALESVGKQSFTNWEVLAVDDCGPDDGTRETVKSFAKQYPHNRVEYIRHVTNQGVSSARNTALQHARGDIIAFLDPDDLWRMDHLAVGLQGLQVADVVVTGSRVIDACGADLGSVVVKRHDFVRSEFPKYLGERNYYHPGCVMMLRKVCDQVGPFDNNPKIQHAEDWDYWLRAVDAGWIFKIISSETAFYRKHPLGATADKKKSICAAIYCLRKHLKCNFTSMRPHLKRGLVRQFQRLAMDRARRGEWRALLNAMDAVLIIPYSGASWRVLVGVIFRLLIGCFKCKKINI